MLLIQIHENQQISEKQNGFTWCTIPYLLVYCSLCIIHPRFRKGNAGNKIFVIFPSWYTQKMLCVNVLSWNVWKQIPHQVAAWPDSLLFVGSEFLYHETDYHFCLQTAAWWSCEKYYFSVKHKGLLQERRKTRATLHSSNYHTEKR
jgi:hypothetical protein